jgi:alanine-synthesizing transaminase
LDEANGWQPDTADIEAKVNDKTRAIVIINPNNPTGSLTTEKTLREIVEIAKIHNLVIFADEIYDKILFNGDKHVSVAALAGDHPCVTFSGLAKSYLGPGLRLGWAVISGDADRVADFSEGFMKMARARLCSSTPTQWAIPAALDGDQSHLISMVARLEKRAELVMSRLNTIKGFRCVKPMGAFYAFPSIDFPDTAFVTRLIQETGVVTVPGSGFGQRPGTNHLRIVFLPPEACLEKAMDLIEKFVKRY